MNKSSTIYAIFIMIVILLITGCAPRPVGSDSSHVTVSFKYELGAIKAPPQFTLIELSVYCPDLDATFIDTLDYIDGFAVGEMDVPVGDDRVFTLMVYDISRFSPLVFSGTVTRDIYPGINPNIVIPLYPQAPTIRIVPQRIKVPIGFRYDLDIKVYNISNASRIAFTLISNNAFMSNLYSYTVDPDRVSEMSLTQIPGNATAFLVSSRNLANAFVDDSGYAYVGRITYYSNYSDVLIEYDSATFTIGPMYAYNTSDQPIPLENVYAMGTDVVYFDLLSTSIGVWHLEEFNPDTISTVEDSSPNKLHGTAYYTSMVEWFLGYGRALDGIKSYIEVPDNNLLDVTDELTIALWVQLDSEESLESTLICKRSPAGDINYIIRYSRLGMEHLSFAYGPSDVGNVHRIPISLLDNQPHFISFSIKFGYPETAVWVIDSNIVEGDWVYGDGYSVPQANTGNLQIGRETSDSIGGYLTGYVDEISIFGHYFRAFYLQQLYFSYGLY